MLLRKPDLMAIFGAIFGAALGWLAFLGAAAGHGRGAGDDIVVGACTDRA